MKITLKEFWSSKETLAIHCDTEAKANVLLKAFHELGKTWLGGKSYLENNYWSVHEKYTCYYNDNLHDDIFYAIEHKIKVYSFDDVIFYDKEELLKAELFDRLLPHLYITPGCIELRLFSREMREIHKVKTHNGLSITNDELMKDLNDFQNKLLKEQKNG